MLRLKKYFILIIIALTICPANVFAQQGNGQNQVIKKNSMNTMQISNGNRQLPRPVLAITPREMDMGIIGAGETSAGIFTLKNMGYGIMGWSTAGPEGWKVSGNQNLSGTIEDDADYLNIEINVFPIEQTITELQPKVMLYPVEIKLTAETGNLICRKDLPAGLYREAIKVTSSGGLRTIFVKFKIVSSQDSAQINLNPERLDMGIILQGKTVSKKIRLNNKGKEILKWSVALQKQKRGDVQPEGFKKGKYVSFVNEEARGRGVYDPAHNLREFMSLTGTWAENDGYPASAGGDNLLKFQFNGTGLILYFTTYPDMGNLTIYVDENLINEHNWLSYKKEKAELLIIEGLSDGNHSVTLVNKDGRLDIEGVRILGKEILRGPAGWISLFPDSGSTTLETEYINVKLNTAQLIPGFYGDNIVFNSNGGEAIVEVFVEVVPEKTTKLIDVFRYSRGIDFLFTADPQAEHQRLSQNTYVKEGIAFRLFVPETPGTTGFYRWYHPQKKDHFYHHDLKGGGKQMQGYLLEGSIGNIATSRMTNTKELYRWINPATGHYFYTTDAKGEKMAKKGYRFDGIAGYVR